MHYTVKNVYHGFGRFLLQKKIKSMLFTAFMILCGNALLAFLVAAFIIPHDIIMGGTTGIGIVLSLSDLPWANGTHSWHRQFDG